MRISRANKLSGEIVLPGDKSISHRAAMLLALAEGSAEVSNFASSEDCASTLSCLGALGVGILRDGDRVTIKGVGKQGFTSPASALDCGNSGTTMRLMSGLLAGQPFRSVLIGDRSLESRPMGRVIEPMRRMGVKIDSREGTAPLTIHGVRSLEPIEYVLPMSSAQVKSCVLLAGLNCDGSSAVRSPATDIRRSPSRDHTELMLEYLGAILTEDFIEVDDGFAHRIEISGHSNLTARDIYVPSDISSASFFLVAASCLPGSELTIGNVGLNPTRSAVIEVLEEFGADIMVENKRTENNEIIGDLRVKGSLDLGPANGRAKLDGALIANLIDEIPVLAVMGTQMNGGLEVRDASELRAKESDRISTVVTNLKLMGAKVTEYPDGFRVFESKLNGSKVSSFGDHRIAMAFAVAGLFASGETEILDPECAAVSFPEFFQVLENVVV